MKNILEKIKEFGLKKIIIIALTIVLLIILGFIVLPKLFPSDEQQIKEYLKELNIDTDKKSNCYDVKYLKNQKISGKIKSGTNYKDGNLFEVEINSKQDCGITLGAMSIITDKKNEMDLKTNALKYTVILDEYFITEGVINKEDIQRIYSNFTFEKDKEKYQIYIWIDETVEGFEKIKDQEYLGYLYVNSIEQE